MGLPPKKRPREKPTLDSERSAIFDDLAHENEEIRIKAAARLLSRLAKARDHTEYDYCLKRLIRGLCSSRKAARLGFSIALTEVLSEHAHSKDAVADILKQLRELTEISGQMNGQEAQDHLMGRVFGAEAIALSGIIFQERGNDSLWRELLDLLLVLAAKKVRLREECGWVCLTALQKLKASASGPVNDCWAATVLELLVTHGIAKTPEGIALWITVDKLFEEVSKPTNIFAENNPLAKKNWRSLLLILKEATVSDGTDEEKKQAQRSSWSAKPHFAWDLIFKELPEGQFGRFWREVVDEGLFGSASSHERKHWGFSLFSQMISSTSKDRLPELFTTNLCKSMANHAATKDRFLHLAAERSLKTIVARMEVELETCGPIVTRVLNKDLRAIFLNDPLRARIVDKALTLAKGQPAEQATLDTLPSDDQVFRDPEKSLELLEVFTSMIKSKPYPKPNSPDVPATRRQYSAIVSKLILGTYFTPHIGKQQGSTQVNGKGSKPHAEKYRARLWTCLNSLSSKEKEPTYYYASTVRMMSEFEKSSGKSLVENEEVLSTIRQAQKAVFKLAQSDSADVARDKSLMLLLSVCIIQVCNGEPDALEAMDDLLKCFDDLNEDEGVDSKSRASDTIVGMLLSFVSNPSTLPYQIAQYAMTLCTDVVTEDGVQAMLDVLVTKESVSGQMELFERRDDEEEEEEEEEEAAEAEDDEASQQDSDEDSDEGSDSDSDDVSVENPSGDSSEFGSDVEMIDAAEEGQEDVENLEELEEFDSKLAEALGTRRANGDLEHDENELSESESDMDDEQMEALDGHLSQIFKQRKEAEDRSKKKEQKGAKQSMRIFKSRVLDLLRIYVKQQHQNLYTMTVLPSLLHLSRTTQYKPLTNKAEDLIYTFMRLLKLRKDSSQGSDASVMRERSRELLDEVHEAALLSGVKRYQQACGRASMTLVKIYLSNGGNFEEIEKRYAKTESILELDKKCNIKPEFFADWQNGRRSGNFASFEKNSRN